MAVKVNSGLGDWTVYMEVSRLPQCKLPAVAELQCYHTVPRGEQNNKDAMGLSIDCLCLLCICLIINLLDNFM